MADGQDDPHNDPRQRAWMQTVERHACWIARAVSAIAAVEGHPEDTEIEIDRWIRIGHEELGSEVNLLSLLSSVALPPTPTGRAADARLRRRRAMSEQVYGAVLRAQVWQEDVLYLCPDYDGLLLIRLHFRTMAVLESGEWDRSALDAALWVVCSYIAEQGLVPATDRPVPRMEDVQRRAYAALSREIEALRATTPISVDPAA